MLLFLLGQILHGPHIFCERPRDDNLKTTVLSQRISEADTKKNPEEVACFNESLFLPPHLFPLFIVSPSSDLDALGNGGGGCRGSHPALRL